jgi:negative regulator of replication initiation
MMPTIRIDDDVWQYLQSKAKPFEDSPNDVLRRELGLNKPNHDNQARSREASHENDSLRPDKDYTHHRVAGYRFEGRNFPARSFKDVLLGLSDHLRKADRANFDKVALALRGRKRVYFSLDPAELKSPEQLSGTGLFIETNLNANIIIGVCRVLLSKLGRDPGQLEIN